MIGAPVRRREDRPLLTGRGGFLDDLAPAGTLELAFVRSTHAHAELHDVDATEAARLPGVSLAFTAADLRVAPLVPDLTRPGAQRIERPILAADRARFVGEPLAAVVASNRYRAEDGAERVAVRYRPLAAVMSVEDALRSDLPPLHNGSSTANVIFAETYDYGDVDAGFEAATAVVQRTFRNPRYSATPIEPRGVLAVPQDGGLVVWSSTQIPHIVQEALAALLDVERVSVRCPDIGGGFGQKAHVFPEEVAVAWAALALGRPVKWAEDRLENFVSATHAREQLVHVRAGADASGRLLALEAEVYSDVGAYGTTRGVRYSRRSARR